MEDTQIFRIALITAILGLTGMMLLSGKVMPEEIKIKDIDKGMIGEEITIEGVVEKIDKSSQSNTYFLQIVDDTGKTSAVIFDATVLEIEKSSLNIGSFANHRIKMTGKVTEYNGNIELILKDAKSIKIIV